jgi:hypothetical protein
MIAIGLDDVENINTSRPLNVLLDGLINHWQIRKEL